jgi:hypothetical protein
MKTILRTYTPIQWSLADRTAEKIDFGTKFYDKAITRQTKSNVTDKSLRTEENFEVTTNRDKIQKDYEERIDKQVNLLWDSELS